MKFGDSVNFIENGVEVTAIVLGSRTLDDHSGANGEELLHLGFFQEVLAPGPGNKRVVKNVLGTQAQHELVQFRLDVAHDSHEFSDEAKKQLGKPIYPGGRWKEQEISTFTGRVEGEDGEEGASKKKKKKGE